MPHKKYIVDLTDEEEDELLAIVRKGNTSARKFTRARILLKANEGWKDADIAAALNCGVATVERTRQRFVEGNLNRALHDNPRPGKGRKLDGRGEAQLVALACSDAPPGRDQWSLRLLADKLVELKVVAAISHETVRQCLKKTN